MKFSIIDSYELRGVLLGNLYWAEMLVGIFFKSSDINGISVDRRGDKRWYKNGKLHREDGPAVEWSDGALEWWLEGKFISGNQYD